MYYLIITLFNLLNIIVNLLILSGIFLLNIIKLICFIH